MSLFFEIETAFDLLFELKKKISYLNKRYLKDNINHHSVILLLAYIFSLIVNLILFFPDPHDLHFLNTNLENENSWQNIIIDIIINI